MKYDVLIVGAGPGGLCCAQKLAAHGARVLVLERNKRIGTKVCAGGITWSGLLNRIPADLVQRSFTKQTITTRRQRVVVTAAQPILATINRTTLGHFMADRAVAHGAQLRIGARLTGIAAGSASYRHEGKNHSVSYDYLVGADGSNSMVRSYLKLPCVRMGIGINYHLPVQADEMIWNFDTHRFGSGYSWIFPHRRSISAGAYLASRSLQPQALKKNLRGWLQENGLIVNGTRPQAGKINCDFHGWRFGRIFLVGDAAGLASPLTGEGIFPAIVSAETVAGVITTPEYPQQELLRLLKKHHKHGVMLRIADRCRLHASLMAEVSAFLLKRRWLTFTHFEMA